MWQGGGMKELPEHVEAELRRLFDEGLPAERMAFMMHLSPQMVEQRMPQVESRRGMTRSKP
jgi:hypothetical protein